MGLYDCLIYRQLNRHPSKISTFRSRVKSQGRNWNPGTNPAFQSGKRIFPCPKNSSKLYTRLPIILAAALTTSVSSAAEPKAAASAIPGVSKSYQCELISDGKSDIIPVPSQVNYPLTVAIQGKAVIQMVSKKKNQVSVQMFPGDSTQTPVSAKISLPHPQVISIAKEGQPVIVLACAPIQAKHTADAAEKPCSNPPSGPNTVEQTVSPLVTALSSDASQSTPDGGMEVPFTVKGMVSNNMSVAGGAVPGFPRMGQVAIGKETAQSNGYPLSTGLTANGSSFTLYIPGRAENADPAVYSGQWTLTGNGVLKLTPTAVAALNGYVAKGFPGTYGSNAYYGYQDYYAYSTAMYQNNIVAKPRITSIAFNFQKDGSQLVNGNVYIYVAGYGGPILLY